MQNQCLHNNWIPLVLGRAFACPCMSTIVRSWLGTTRYSRRSAPQPFKCLGTRLEWTINRLVWTMIGLSQEHLSVFDAFISCNGQWGFCTQVLLLFVNPWKKRSLSTNRQNYRTQKCQTWLHYDTLCICAYCKHDSALKALCHDKGAIFDKLVSHVT